MKANRAGINRSRARRLGPAAVATAFVMLLAACSSGSDSGGTTGGAAGGSTTGVTDTVVKLSATQTLSGPGAVSCKGITDAADLWFKHVNDAGGVNGRTIEFTVLDDGYDPSRAIANLRTLEPENFAMVGACGSATAAAIYKPMSEKGMPFLFPINGDGTLVRPPTPGMFQVQPLYEDEMATLVTYGYGEFGAGSVYTVVNPLGAYDQVIARSKQVAEANGGSFVGSSVTPLGTPDYTPIALQIKAANPDYVLMSMGGTDYAKMINAMLDQDAMPNKLAMMVSASGAFINAYNEEGAEKIRAASLVQLPIPADSECGKVLSADAALAADPVAIGGCAVAQLITTAIGETKDLTRENISATIQGWTDKDAAPGVLAPVTFSAEQHLGTTQIYIVQPTGRSYKTLAVCPYGDGAELGVCTPVE